MKQSIGLEERPLGEDGFTWEGSVGERHMAEITLVGHRDSCDDLMVSGGYAFSFGD